MVNAQVLKGQWNEVRGQLKKKWGQLTDDDLRLTNGNIDQLVGVIQRKTGEAREAIEQFLDTVTAHGAFNGLSGGGRCQRIWPHRDRSNARRIQSPLGRVQPRIPEVGGDDPRQSGAVGRHGIRCRNPPRRRGRFGLAVALGANSRLRPRITGADHAWRGPHRFWF